MPCRAASQTMEPMDPPAPSAARPIPAERDGTGPIVPLALIAIGSAGASLVWIAALLLQR